MGPLAITGMVAAIIISIGLVLALLSPAFSGKSSKDAAPNLPGVIDQLPTSNAGAQPAPQIPTDEPSPTPTATPSRRTTAAVGDTAAENAVVAFVNAERRKARCKPVRVDGGLRNAARQHSADMAAGGFLSHNGSDGSSAADRMRAAGVDHPLSEDVARGFTSAGDVVQAWLRNRNDRDNIVDCDAKVVGVGVAVSADGTPYWTQDFGR
jgi:uncharacterized protein YkwD